MTAQPKTAPWDDDPAGASILLATGRPQHDLLVIAEPFFLTELREAWGRPASSVRLSFLPGVSAPSLTGLEDSLQSYEHDGLSILIARGRTSLFEGKPARRTTAFARTAAARVRAALLITRATGLGGVEPGDFLPVGDHLNLAGAPLFPALGVIEAAWDEDLTARLSALDGVREPGVLALAPGPLRPTRAEAGVLAALGADGVVTDSVAEAMALASRGVRVAGLAYVDAIADQSAGRPVTTGRRAEHRAGAHSAGLIRVPAPDVVRAAVETVLTGLH
ncbi:purine-nucleoside phosphorylase [Actinomyces gerencseriae]|uniref:phosphorylase family protein n=1 Tax=Actinomyces gerencseriae TaxID=52769 RepID=UPI0023F16AF3|nr:purine-nucleoside phosphorylase [Actinomyces gerencseriae]